MNRIISLLAVALCGCFVRGGSLRADEAPPAAQEPSLVRVYEAKIDRASPLGASYVIKGESNLKFKKALVTADEERPASFTVMATIDAFPREMGDSLLLLVKDKYFVPEGWGGDGKIYWSLDLKRIDRAHAEILAGAPLPEAPKDQFLIQYAPQSTPYAVGAPVKVQLALKNVGAIPLSIYYATDGGGNYPCRDTQLSFTATLDGAAVAPNPKPLPDGFLSHPFLFKPDTWLKRQVNLSEWLQFDKPGKYTVDADYKLTIRNPVKDTQPAQWQVVYHNRFSVQLGE